MMYGYGYGMGVWMIIGWVIMAAVIILAVYGLIILLRRTDAGTMSYKPVDSLSILKERLAKGEIDTEEYRKIKEELQK